LLEQEGKPPQQIQDVLGDTPSGRTYSPRLFVYQLLEPFTGSNMSGMTTQSKFINSSATTNGSARRYCLCLKVASSMSTTEEVKE
jgi:hypothetical protein